MKFLIHNFLFVLNGQLFFMMSLDIMINNFWDGIYDENKDSNEHHDIDLLTANYNVFIEQNKSFSQNYKEYQ